MNVNVTDKQKILSELDLFQRATMCLKYESRISKVGFEK